MSKKESAIDRLLRTQQMINTVSDQIGNSIATSLPSIAAIQSQYAFMNWQNTLSISVSTALSSLSSITLKTQMTLPEEVAASLSSITQMQTRFAVSNLTTVLNSIAKSVEFATKTLPLTATSAYINSLSSRWNAIIAELPTCPDEAGWDDDTAPLNKEVASKVCNIVEKTVPNENPDKKTMLDKIKGNVSAVELIGIIGTIISILLTVYGYISADAEQKKVEQQNQVIIEEFHRTESAIEKNESDQKNILLAVQQLTETAQELEGYLQPKGLQGEQDETDVNQPDSNSYPKD